MPLSYEASQSDVSGVFKPGLDVDKNAIWWLFNTEMLALKGVIVPRL